MHKHHTYTNTTHQSSVCESESLRFADSQTSPVEYLVALPMYVYACLPPRHAYTDGHIYTRVVSFCTKSQRSQFNMGTCKAWFSIHWVIIHINLLHTDTHAQLKAYLCLNKFRHRCKAMCGDTLIQKCFWFFTLVWITVCFVDLMQGYFLLLLWKL